MFPGQPPIAFLQGLNALGLELTMAAGGRQAFPRALAAAQRQLGVPVVMLWRALPGGDLKLEAVHDSAEPLPPRPELEAIRPLLANGLCTGEIDGWAVLTVPLPGQSERVGAMALLHPADAPAPWYRNADAAPAAMGAMFLDSIAGQLGMFCERQSLETTQLLFREIHHRVKNNLQMVASLLRMQLRRIDRVSAERALEESMARILAIAMIHDLLCHTEQEQVEAQDMVRRLAHLARDAAPSTLDARLDLPSAPILLAYEQASALALVLNELIQNALRHGAASRDNRLALGLRVVQGNLSAWVQDWGGGLPADFDLGRSANLGLTIVETLVDEPLNGTLTLENTTEGGMRATVTIPLERSAPWR
jgi:two-component sensor histidine kinase